MEAYDYYKNKWTYLPGINDKWINYESVSMGSKLFVIEGSRISSLEVFDSVFR